MIAKKFITHNARIRYIPDENGIMQPYEMLVFNRSLFVEDGFEVAEDRRQFAKSDLPDDVVLLSSFLSDADSSRQSDAAENRRKSYGRARNNLFNLLLCTTEFDCFVTLTLDPSKIDRYDYDVVMKAWRVWFDNRVRRHGLVYAFVPEFHKDGAIHFHGLCNFSALKTVRATNPYTGLPLCDKSNGKPLYNIVDFPYGLNSVELLSGENCREACAKYVYKYITKTHGEKVGGRYYLSGGKLGRPMYDLTDVMYDEIDAPEFKIVGGVCCKKVRL